MTWNSGNLIQSNGAPKSGGSPTSVEVQRERTLHVFYRAPVNNTAGADLVELWWGGAEVPNWGYITRGDGIPPADPYGDPTCHVLSSQLHVIYRSFENHLVDLRWTGSESPVPHDLTTTSGQPVDAAGDPISHVVEKDGIQAVLYPNMNSHIIDLSFSDASDPLPRDLVAESSGLLTSGKPASHVLADGSQHLFYLACGHIIELAWQGSDVPQVRDLSLLAVASGGAPEAALGPVSHITSDGKQHVFYTSSFGNIVELSWHGTDTPQVRDLNLPNDGSPAVASRLTSYAFDHDGTQHLFYIGNTDHPVELSFTDTGPAQVTDLTQEFGVPIGQSNLGPASLVFSKEQTQHVFYTTPDGAIVELWR